MVLLFYLLMTILTNSLLIKCDLPEVYPTKYEPDDTDPNYSYSYGVKDDETGDFKSMWEARDGKTVKGQYSVLEPDGSTRTVEYTADPKMGFKAIVKNDGNSFDSQKDPANSMEKKSFRDYGKYEPPFDYHSPYALTENEDQDTLSKFSFGNDFKDYSHSSHHSYFDKPFVSESNSIKPEYKTRYTTIPLPKKKSKYTNKNEDEDIYSKVVEIDLTKNFKHLTYKPNNENRVIVRDSPEIKVEEDYSENYYNEPSNVDLQKLISPFAINGHFKMPKLIETGFQPITSPSKYKHANYEPAADLDLYELTQTSDIGHIYPEMDYVKKPLTKNKINQYKRYVKPELFHYTSSNSMNDFTVLPKKKYRSHMKIVNPNFEYTSYLPPDYTISNLDEDYSPPHYTLDYETIHIPQDLNSKLNRGVRDRAHAGKRSPNKRERRPSNIHSDYFY